MNTHTYIEKIPTHILTYFVFLSCLIKLKYVEDYFSYFEKDTLTVNILILYNF